MFKRKIYSDLLQWKKESQGKTALLVEVLKLSCPVTKLISMLVSKLLLRLSCENYVVRGSCYLPRTLY